MPIQKMQQRRDTTANWSSANPVLAAGEIGFDSSVNKFKIGNGTAAWNSLAYAGGTTNASELTSGTLNDARLSNNVVLTSTIGNYATPITGVYVLDDTLQSANSGGMWGPRDGAALMFLGSDAYLIGGWGGSAYDTNWSSNGVTASTNQVYKSTDLGVTWTRIRSHDTTPDSTHFRPGHTLAHCLHTVSGTQYMYLFGGDAGDTHSEVRRSTDGNTWNQVNSVQPGWHGRFLMSAGSIAGKLFLAGGHTSLIAGTAQNGVYKSIDHGATWSALSNAPWAARFCFENIPVFQGKLWIVAGGRYDDNPSNRLYYNDVWSFDPDTETWTEVLANGLAPWPARYYHNVFVFRDWLYVSRGFNSNGNLSDTWRTQDGVKWSQCDLPLIDAKPSHADSIGIHSTGVLVCSGNGYLVGTPSNTDSPTHFLEPAYEGFIAPIAHEISESQVIDLSRNGYIREGYTEGTSPKSITQGNNNKLVQYVLPNYSEGQPDKSVLGAYATSSKTYLYIGGGLDSSVECSQELRVYLGDDNTTVGTEHFRIGIEESFFKVNSLGIGGQTGVKGIDVFGQTILLGANESDNLTRGTNAAKIAKLLMPRYSGTGSIQVFGGYSYGADSHKLYFGGGLSFDYAASAIEFWTAPNSTLGTIRFKIDGSGLWIDDAGTMKLVSFGANDSAGSGYKVLRIAN